MVSVTKQSNITIREIAESEHEFLFDVVYEASYIPEGVEKPPKSFVYDPSVSRYVEEFGREGDVAFLLADGDELVGGIWCRLFSADYHGYGFIDESTPELGMAVFEGYRDRGFGTQLMQRLIDSLKVRGFDQVSLSVDHRNPALRLYKRFGFETVREEGVALIMIKRL
jgi:ribosomal protein S18 acetylase RimI-like enzyme